MDIVSIFNSGYYDYRGAFRVTTKARAVAPEHSEGTTKGLGGL